MDGFTPRLTDHARQRCQEMQVATKRVKRLVRCADLRYAAKDDCWIAVCDADPEIAVVFKYDGELPIVITVLYRGIEYVRP